MSKAVEVEEEAIFDRQTRLWGAEAQAQIRSSSVLVRGSFLGLSAEICKNLALAGVNLVLLRDSQPVREEDISCNVFFHQEDAAKQNVERTSETVLARIRDMTFARVQCVEEAEGDLSQYKIVVSVNESFEVMRALGQACRASKVPLLCCREASMLGFVILDFGAEYVFRRDDDSNAGSIAKFAPLSDVLAFDQFDLLNKKTSFGFYALLLAAQQQQRNDEKKRIKLDMQGRGFEQEELDRAVQLFASNGEENSATSRSSMPPICTILGGLVGNEVLKAVSGKGEPSNNVIFFDGKDASASVRRLPPFQ